MAMMRPYEEYIIIGNERNNVDLNGMTLWREYHHNNGEKQRGVVD